jgi:hypothetical protein
MSSTSGIYLDCRLICVVSTLARFTFGKELAWYLAETLTRSQLWQNWHAMQQLPRGLT